VVTLADTPEAEAIAARFGVPAAIHTSDFMFMFHLGPDQADWPRTRPAAIELYFSDGARSATRLNELVGRFHSNRGQRVLRVLEFASGYGMVSRHIARMKDRYASTACDIHEQAVVFREGVLGVEAILSRTDPEALILTGDFDVAFALSFFSHASPRTWGRWLRILSRALADNGLLIFTAHGRGGYERAGRPRFQLEGFCSLRKVNRKTCYHGTMAPC
jgi:SAM-dependent methyltransferase